MGVVTKVVLVSVVTISNFSPTANALPGGSTLLHLINGVGGWALLLALAGLLIGAGLWAIGSHSQNYQQSYVGRRAVLVSGVAALLIGAAPTLINFFFNTGHGIVNPLPH
jgi:MFS family permease